ncbi:hypothetical protein N321_03221, partial [Antrostomus carolinensis]
GRNLGVLVKIHQDSVNGTVGRSVLLPVSYRFPGAPCFPLSILWTFGNSSDMLMTSTVSSCSLGAGGVPTSCSAQSLLHPMYHGHVEFFPENGSLLLHNPQLQDSGVYNI